MADENSLDKLVEQMNGDIRQILGFLQVWSKRPDNNFIYATFSKDIEKFKKDQAVTVSNFDAATILLNKAQVNIFNDREAVEPTKISLVYIS